MNCVYNWNWVNSLKSRKSKWDRGNFTLTMIETVTTASTNIYGKNLILLSFWWQILLSISTLHAACELIKDPKNEYIWEQVGILRSHLPIHSLASWVKYELEISWPQPSGGWFVVVLRFPERAISKFISIAFVFHVIIFARVILRANPDSLLTHEPPRTTS